MDIPLHASVYCDKELVGHVNKVILNPVSKELTHMVVKPKGTMHLERIISIKKILHSSPERIDLDCTRTELEQQEAYQEVSFVQIDIPDYFGVDYLTIPHTQLERPWVKTVHEHIPAGDLSIRRGTAVTASDGHVGWVDEFVVNPDTGHISHLVMLQNHGFAKDDVTIAVAMIAEIKKGAIRLSLSKAELAKLPHVRVKRLKHSDPTLGD